MSSGYVILIIVLILGFIVGNLMMLRHIGKFNISAELRKTIEQNNLRADQQAQDEKQ
ncbi:DUF2897 family protein [Agarivorans sp. Z349TD_8]|uniref:DUF2897 family protein n=1 Tax=Agarivorans sp. Z349TD_8 TaxID=3421434 RepID=UPI003D7C516A